MSVGSALVSKGKASRKAGLRSTTLSGVNAHARSSATLLIVVRSMTYCASSPPVNWPSAVRSIFSLSTTLLSVLSSPRALMWRTTWSGASRAGSSGW